LKFLYCDNLIGQF